VADPPLRLGVSRSLIFTPLRIRKAPYAKHSIDALIYLGNARAQSTMTDERQNGVIRVAPVTIRVKNSATFTRVLRVKTLSESDDWKPISPKFNNVVARALIYFWLVAGNITYGASCVCP